MLGPYAVSRQVKVTNIGGRRTYDLSGVSSVSSILSQIVQLVDAVHTVAGPRDLSVVASGGPTVSSSSILSGASPT